MLAIEQEEQHWYYDVLRNVFWQISKGVLHLLDGFFDIIDKIWRFKFFDNPYVEKVFQASIIVACSWLVLKVVLELVMNHIVKNDGKGNPLIIYRGVVLAIVTMFLIPSLFTFGHNISTKMTEAVISINTVENNSSNKETQISNAIVSSMVHQNETKKEDALYIAEHWKTVDINDTERNDDGTEVYKYSLNLFMLVVLSIVVLFLFFFIAIQMSKRVIEIALYKILGPFCCTSLTSGSRTFQTWVKCTMGAFLVTVTQFVSIGLLFNLFGTAFEQSNILVGLFLIIGALLFIINTPQIVTSLLDQQAGAMSGFGDMQSLMAIGNGIKSGLSVAGTATQAGLSAISKVSGGASKIGGNVTNMFKGGKGSFTKEQKQTVKDSMERHNSSRAWKQTRDFTNQNMNKETNNKTSGYNANMNNGFKRSSSMKYNNMRNEYNHKNNGSFFSRGGK